MEELPRHLALDEILLAHEIALRATGQEPQPLRNPEARLSALHRPINAALYRGADLIEQAGILAVAISQAQAFTEGNKRTAFAAADVFLRVNGADFDSGPVELGVHLEAVAQRLSDREQATDEFVAWLRPLICTLPPA